MDKATIEKIIDDADKVARTIPQLTGTREEIKAANHLRAEILTATGDALKTLRDPIEMGIALIAAGARKSIFGPPDNNYAHLAVYAILTHTDASWWIGLKDNIDRQRELLRAWAEWAVTLTKAN